ncbi:MAG: exodeoxyribonuclease VII small subunit [Alphaproteobacteria bacterium]|jgi:exodeoxyribonuclease VII small subunit|nr:exodeoxyribonuclease VII small subunit [Alphaproteobacteria bacterium]
MAEPDCATEIETLSFEQALEELEDIVRRLESGDIDLDGAIGAYQRGAALKAHCENKLRQAQEKVSRIKLDADSGVTVEEPSAGEAGDEPPF